jgi:hypothetical protein
MSEKKMVVNLKKKERMVEKKKIVDLMKDKMVEKKKIMELMKMKKELKKGIMRKRMLKKMGKEPQKVVEYKKKV